MNEYHLLYVHDLGGNRMFSLNSATVSIGRDASNMIEINDPYVSRRHIMLLRVPSQITQYAYRLIDGSTNGQSSKNGVQVNHQVCTLRDLESGDRIQMGTTHISYLIASMTPAEYTQHFTVEAIEMMGCSAETLDPTETLAGKLLPPQQILESAF